MSELLDILKKKDPGETEFHQAVQEVVESVRPLFHRHKEYRKLRILERVIEPERIIIFKVPWVDDSGEVRINRGYRVQMNSAIGPYKGGTRFHPSVNLSILKFLAFEQTFKNALTTLPLGGGKGGSDFDPKDKSDNESMAFCQSYMSELYRHIGHNTDIPAGDIGVGAREIGYLFGMYKKLKNEFTGTITGKGLEWGGSYIRPEATGYGLIYFATEMLAVKGGSFVAKKCLVSGSGNVSQHAIEKIIELGGIVLTVSDSSGYIYDEHGIDRDKLSFIQEIKNVKRGRIKEYADKYSKSVYTAFDPDLDHNPLWDHKADCAFPCATQNEINEKDATNLVNNGVKLVAEGANMPTTINACKVFMDAKTAYAPGKASNAGGVATSGLEMIQNKTSIAWTREDVDKRLHNIMKNIHRTCLETAVEYNMAGNYLAGANIAGFFKIAEAMRAQGVV
ncbi:MAG: NADP-specific glutamate dehydrogenase [Cytophagales bacterium]|nr:NADP-specific glutamate dehydrogenase [Cytophagales bacterium]